MKTNRKEELDTRERTEKLFNFRPLFFAAVFLCLGILFFYCQRFKGLSSLWFLVLLALAAFPFFFCRSVKRIFQTGLAVLLCGCSFFFGGLLFERQLDDFASAREYEGTTSVRGRIVKIVDRGEKTEIYLSDLRIGKNKEEGQLVAYLPASFAEEYHLSDLVYVYGEVDTATEFFDFYGFREGHIGDKLRFVCYGESMVKFGEEFDLFLWARERMKKALYAGMDETMAAATMGILLGDTTGIEEELYDNIRYGGIAHIFSVSGLHFSAAFGFCLLIINRWKGKIGKPFRFLIVAVVLIFYAGVCGYSSPVIRSMVICLVFYAYALLNMQSDFLEALGASAIFILLFDPVELFNVGFQLSFAGCLGIALAAPLQDRLNVCFEKLERKFPRKLTAEERGMLREGDTLPPGVWVRIRRAVVSFFSVSLWAQIFTAPILLSAFSYISGWALLLNCVFVPLISAVFSFVLLFAVIACCLPALFSQAILYVPNVIFSTLLLLFEALDFSTFAFIGPKLSLPFYLCYYAALLLISDKFNLTKRYKRLFSALCFSAFILSMVVSYA